MNRLGRSRPVCSPRIRRAQQWCPVRYVLFDLVYHDGRCLMREPLLRRREVLAEVCQNLDEVDVRFSEGVVGQGRALYAAVVVQGHEGVMAKHLASTYQPGRRSASWRKIPFWLPPCVGGQEGVVHDPPLTTDKPQFLDALLSPSAA